jgi:hypothetical protein
MDAPTEKQSEGDLQEKVMLADSEKHDMLMEMLKERYIAEHNMRERSTSFSIWVLGLGIALIWVLLIQVHLTVSQKVITCVFILTYTGFSFKFIYEIAKGFNSNRNIIIKIEHSLGFHAPGYYVQNSSIFPKQYQTNYKKSKLSSHFKSLFWLLATVAIFLLILTIANPVKDDKKNDIEKFAPHSSSIC